MTDRPEGTAETDFFAREYKITGGWRLPLHSNHMSYIYVGLLDVAFEVWLGGDSDVTVRLKHPFTFGLGDKPIAFDPRTTRKSELAPLLDVGTLEVDEFLVKEIGELDITFTDGRRLVAGSAKEEAAWCLEWPTAGEVRVAARPEVGLYWPGAVQSPVAALPDDPTSPTAFAEPIRRGGIVELPVRGLVTRSTSSGMSIELAMRINGTDEYDLHFGGGMEITGPAGDLWRGHGDADDRSTLGRVLDLVGKHVTEAHVDDAERLQMAFADGAQLVAAPGRWEAHWPAAAGSLDEYWVPLEGPSIP